MRRMKGLLFVLLCLAVFVLTPGLVLAESKPVVTITDMEINPYEGNPMEVVIEAIGTNLKYQWQISYGDDSSGWSGVVDLDDNARYQGTKTPHFKIHTYFGDTFDEDLDFAKARCKVTGDGGTSYSQEVWFVIRDRAVVEECSFNGLTEPVYGEHPGYAVEAMEPDKYEVADVNWFGPELSNGKYHKMNENSIFEEGNYYCRIDIAVKDAYKFDTSTSAYVDGSKTEVKIISGEQKNPTTVDSYYIIQRFTIEKEIIKTAKIIDIKMPVDGENMQDASYTTANIPEDAPYTLKSVNWYEEDGSLTENKAFEANTKYRLRVVLSPKAGYRFDLDETLVTVNGSLASVNNILEDGDVSIVFFAKAAEAEVPDKPVIPDKIKNPFRDVKETDYYYDAILWAVDKGITAGVTADSFAPEAPCTRAQAVTFLWRNAGEPQPKGLANPFIDIREGTYYYKAVLWAVEEGITAGVTPKMFRPDDVCSRGQIVTFLWRAKGCKEVSITNPFTDVVSQDYYYKAVLWAVDEGITAGITPTTFCPNMDCTRGQIVTFLYRSEKNT